MRNDHDRMMPIRIVIIRDLLPVGGGKNTCLRYTIFHVDNVPIIARTSVDQEGFFDQFNEIFSLNCV